MNRFLGPEYLERDLVTKAMSRDELDGDASACEQRAKIAQLVGERSTRRGIHTDPMRLLYANECVYQWCREPPPRTLYVGVGHGFDALLALQAGLTGKITGVDPYVDTDGNDSEDYGQLIEIIAEFNMQDCFVVERTTIQDYLDSHREKFDLILCNDVLHHIFWTEKYLTRSEYFSDAVRLFRDLRAATEPGGSLVVADVERHGLRQILASLGVLSTSVDYGAKQPRREWCRAATEAGWVSADQTNYVPWALRHQAKVWAGILGRYTLCDKYLLHFSNSLR